MLTDYEKSTFDGIFDAFEKGQIHIFESQRKDGSRAVILATTPLPHVLTVFAELITDNPADRYVPGKSEEVYGIGVLPQCENEE